MRTFSRLDFLAKSLTLAVLGVLGLSAALLDRWTAAFPAVPPPGVTAGAPSVQTALGLPGSGPGALTSPSKPRRFSDRLPETQAPAPKEDSARIELAPMVSDDLPVSIPGQLPIAVESAPIAGSVVTLSLPPVVDTWQPMAASAAAPTERTDEGFVSGVLKRTGSTVSSSLGKASNSVVGAVRVVGDVVKRAF